MLLAIITMRLQKESSAHARTKSCTLLAGMWEQAS